MVTRNATAIGGEAPTNGAAESIEMTMPYVATVRIEGTADLLFHRWNVEAVEEKSKAAKGSKAKKTDNIESYVWRNDEGELCLPGIYLCGALQSAGRFMQDPRSPRKSARDLVKAAVVPLTALASLGVKQWDYEHACRVCIHGAAITRIRPALRLGWSCEHQLQVNLPEYVTPHVLHKLLSEAGRLIGVGDFRPTYGRYMVTSFETE